MKRIVYLMCFASLLVGCVGSNAQQRIYPEDVLHVEYPYFTTVKFEGNSPDITDFVTSLVQDEGMPMDSEDLIDMWNRYLRDEQQEPGNEVLVDKKNGYVCLTTEYRDVFDGETRVFKSYCEMCYWNCDDGKHKVFALNLSTAKNGRYIEGQTTGLSLNLYENARHIMWGVVEEDFGVYVAPETDESYECDAAGLNHVKDRETGEPLVLNDEEFWRWLEDKPVVVYRLPRQGKDIIAEIHHATRTDTIKLVWDGMVFKRK